MAEREQTASKFRVIYSDTSLGRVSIEVPRFMKMFFRKGDWKPWRESQMFDDRAKATENLRRIGVLATITNKNAMVLDIEEVRV